MEKENSGDKHLRVWLDFTYFLKVVTVSGAKRIDIVIFFVSTHIRKGISSLLFFLVLYHVSCMTLPISFLISIPSVVHLFLFFFYFLFLLGSLYFLHPLLVQHYEFFFPFFVRPDRIIMILVSLFFSHCHKSRFHSIIATRFATASK